MYFNMVDVYWAMCSNWVFRILSPSSQVVADSNFKYVLEIKDVPKFKDART